jgi:hypothetical protein
MKPAITAAIDDEPMPPGRARRWGVAAIMFAALVIIAWSVWDRIAWRQFQAEVTRLRSAGEPVWETDFAGPVVPDSENAATVLRRAVAETVDTYEQREHQWDGFFEPELSPEAVKVLGRALEANRRALEDSRRLDSMTAVDWGPRWSNDPATFDAEASEVRDLHGASSVAQLLAYAARHAHAIGNDEAAVAYVKDMLAIARVVDTRELEIGHAVAQAIETMASQELEYASPGLCAGDLPGQARPAEMEAIIADLLDAGGRRARMRRAVAYDRPLIVVPGTSGFTRQARHFDLRWGSPIGNGATVTHVAPAFVDSAADRVARPFFLLNAARELRLYAEMAAIEPGDSWPTIPSSLASRARPYHIEEMFGVNWVVSLIQPDPDYGFLRAQSTNAYDTAHAAVSLAARLYQIDHDGQMPATVASLVPGYMAGLPAGVTLPPVPAYLTPKKPKAAPTTLPSTMPATTQTTTR